MTARRRGIRTITKEQLQEAFLRAYARVGSVTEAAEIAGIDPYVHWNDWSKGPGGEAWRARVEEARMQFGAVIEREIYRRGVVGWEEPVYQQGALVGRIRRHSDQLLTLLAKGNMRQRYSEKVEASNTNTNTNLNINTPVDLSKLTDEQLEQLARMGAAVSGGMAAPGTPGESGASESPAA